MLADCSKSVRIASEFFAPVGVVVCIHVMSGYCAGIQHRIKELAPCAIYTHC